MPGEGIKLYPSNWLYNAGVVGFLRVLEECGESVKDFLRDDGSVEIISCLDSDKLFDKWDNLTQEKLKISYKGKKGGTKTYYYANQTEESIRKKIEQLIADTNVKKGRNYFVCNFCGKGFFSKKGDLKFLSQGFSNILLTSERTFPNSYWNNESNVLVCPKCEFIIMCHHIPLVTLFDGSRSNNSELFINAPSFKVMWFLNKYAKIYESNGIKEIKQILGMSLIEMTSKLYLQIGKWEKMNIEVVCKYRERKDDKWIDKVEFFSLPSEIVDLLSNREIANTLNQIGEFKVLNMVLDGKFKDILAFGERLFKIGLKPSNERGKHEKDHEKDFINSEVKLVKNRKDLVGFSQKLFKLYALIESNLKVEV